MIQQPLVPRVWFDETTLRAANDLLERWGHRMGPLRRPNAANTAHVLVAGGEPVAVTVLSTLIRPNVGAGLGWLTRDNAIELSRLCAARPGLCRVALRLWREFVLAAAYAGTYAVSYQDADLHSGNTYRFDGWHRSAVKSRSGTDPRGGGRKGRRKWVWVYPPPPPHLR